LGTTDYTSLVALGVRPCHWCYSLYFHACNPSIMAVSFEGAKMGWENGTWIFTRGNLQAVPPNISWSSNSLLFSSTMPFYWVVLAGSLIRSSDPRILPHGHSKPSSLPSCHWNPGLLHLSSLEIQNRPPRKKITGRPEADGRGLGYSS
jgi:hypothetical protein